MLSIDALINRMEGLRSDLDPVRLFFHDTYLRTTMAIRDDLSRGVFVDADWVERWDVNFAGFYLDALTASLEGTRVPGPWETAFAAAKGSRLPPLRHVLLGMNAHVNYDLPQALLAVITDHEFEDPAVLERRGRDHAAIDEILASRVAAEDENLRAVEQPGDRTWLDWILTPFNRWGTKRFLKEARTKVWHNAQELSAARQHGELAKRLSELERLSQHRVADLVRPGQVIFNLAIHGFGVRLDERPSHEER